MVALSKLASLALILVLSPNLVGAVTSDLLEVDLVGGFAPPPPNGNGARLENRVVCNIAIPEGSETGAFEQQANCFTQFQFRVPRPPPVGTSMLANGTFFVRLLEPPGNTLASDIVNFIVSDLGPMTGSLYNLNITMISDEFQSAPVGTMLMNVNENGTTPGFLRDAKGFIELTGLMTGALGPVQVVDTENFNILRDVHVFAASDFESGLPIPEPTPLFLVLIGGLAIAICRTSGWASSGRPHDLGIFWSRLSSGNKSRNIPTKN